MADNRFFPWFKLEFEQKQEETGLVAVASQAVSKLQSVMPINRNFYEADVKVEMHYELAPNTFEITIAGLSGTIYDMIKANQTIVRIWLGYYMGVQEPMVFEGIVLKKEAKVGDCFYETILHGVEKAWFALDSTCLDDETDLEY